MNNKHANTTQPVHALIASRWSPRAFDDERNIDHNTLAAVLEAARWAPSCFNDQPWRFIVFERQRDVRQWQQAVDILAERNQLWARQAPVLILVCSDGKFGHNDADNRWAQYDAGAAAMSLCLQANATGLAAHQMGGFDADTARRSFNIPEQVTPMAMIALGHHGDSALLDESFISDENAPRQRKPLEQIAFAGNWQSAWSVSREQEVERDELAPA
jgi:nitroreductase